MRQIGMTSRDRPLDVEHYTSGAYGDLFRRGSDTSGLEDCFVERDAGAFIPPNADALEQSPEEAYMQEESFIDRALAISEAQSPADCLSPESADDALTREIQAELRLRCGRQRGRMIEGLRPARIGRNPRATPSRCSTDNEVYRHTDPVNATSDIFRMCAEVEW
jgi:hypothetical protein